MATPPRVKRPDEKLLAGVNFGNKPEIADGSHSLTGTPTVSTQPSVPSGLTDLLVGAVTVDGVNSPVVDSTGQVVLFAISGGTDGESYDLRVDCPVTGGGTRADGVTLIVSWKAGGVGGVGGGISGNFS